MGQVKTKIMMQEGKEEKNKCEEEKKNKIY